MLLERSDELQVMSCGIIQECILHMIQVYIVVDFFSSLVAGILKKNEASRQHFSVCVTTCLNAALEEDNLFLVGINICSWNYG